MEARQFNAGRLSEMSKCRSDTKKSEHECKPKIEPVSRRVTTIDAHAENSLKSRRQKMVPKLLMCVRSSRRARFALVAYESKQMFLSWAESQDSERQMRPGWPKMRVLSASRIQVDRYQRKTTLLTPIGLPNDLRQAEKRKAHEKFEKNIKNFIKSKTNSPKEAAMRRYCCFLALANES